MMDEFMFHRWPYESLLARRIAVVEYVEQCESFSKELNSLDMELALREIQKEENK